MFEDRLEPIELEEAFPYVVFGQHCDLRHGRDHALPQPEPEHSLQPRELAVDGGRRAFFFNRSVLYRSTDAVVM